MHMAAHAAAAAGRSCASYLSRRGLHGLLRPAAAWHHAAGIRRRALSGGGGGSSVCAAVVPIFSDNYAFILADPAAGLAAFVDPADPDALERALRDAPALRGCRLAAVLTTHKHADHTDGNAALAACHPGTVTCRLSLRNTAQPLYTGFPNLFSRCFSELALGFIPGLRVYGPAAEAADIPACTDAVAEGDMFAVSPGRHCHFGRKRQ
jgi:glyoxylase-like metal-dependent hydrolase (beta-lactamase superfamily II)